MLSFTYDTISKQSVSSIKKIVINCYFFQKFSNVFKKLFSFEIHITFLMKLIKNEWILLIFFFHSYVAIEKKIQLYKFLKKSLTYSVNKVIYYVTEKISKILIKYKIRSFFIIFYLLKVCNIFLHRFKCEVSINQ
jgi:hypothetical protein